MNFTTTHARDLLGISVGEKIGRGLSREVFRYTPDKTCVIKVESDGDRFQNIIEWEVWRTVCDTPLAKWFAPCVEISPNGIYLIQKRTEPIPLSRYPKEVPALLGDLKKENFGYLNNRFVCHDYGTMHITAINASLNTRFRKTKWWTEN